MVVLTARRRWRHGRPLRKSIWMPRALSSMDAPRASKERPTAFKTSFLPMRSNSCTPRANSRSLRAALTADCEIATSSAALAVEPERATAEKISICRRVKRRAAMALSARWPTRW